MPVVNLSRAACAGLVLAWITGALLVTNNAVEVPASLADQKLWAKLFIVAVLTFNALLLHGIVRPMVKSRIESTLFGPTLGTVFNRLPITSILFGAVSAMSCLFATYLGVAKALNAEINVIAVSTSYIIALLLTWLAGITLCIVIGYCKMHLEFQKNFAI